jgi:chemotaxis protein MotB
MNVRVLPVLAAFAASFVIAGCGHSEDEWQQAQRDIAKLQADLGAAKALVAQDDKKYADAQKQIDQLNDELKAAGVGKANSEKEAAQLRDAMSQFKASAQQLEQMKARFQMLKERLEKLTSVGLKVVVRNNRMVIQLPGDILFDSGRDTLKPDGKKILKQVADVIKGDSTLSNRNFQVAGYTDKEPYGGAYFDNWGLSVMRARQVVGFLVGPNKADNSKDPKAIPSGGGLDPAHWSAAGYGANDPIAGSLTEQSRDEEQKNRRVEVVLQPNVEEMLNLKDL